MPGNERSAVLVRSGLASPACAADPAVALGVLLPEVDAWWSRSGDDPLGFVFGGGASAARDLLAAIAGSLISVTGLTFSLTVVALQLSSSQYSPRLLQTSVTDRVVQFTLAQLVLTFVYALTVLRTVRTAEASGYDIEFLPRLSITVAYALTIGSVLALVFFLGHLARALRAETMLRDVHDETSRTIKNENEPPTDQGDPAPPESEASDRPVEAGSSGFLVGIDEKATAAKLRDAGAVVQLRVRFGDSVVAGTPVGHVRPDTNRGAVDLSKVQAALEHGLRLDFERSAARDVAYRLRKVMDIVVRALSPGVNDPTTAVHALSHASAILGELADRPGGDRWVRDDDGVIRIVVPAWTPPALLDLVTEETLAFAEGQPAVLRRLAGLLQEFAWKTRGLPVGVDTLVAVERTAHAAVETAHVTDQEAQDWRRRVVEALDGTWSAELP